MVAKVYKGIWSINFVIILIVIFFHYMSVYVLLPITPTYITNHLHAPKHISVLLIAGYSLTAVLFCPIAGYIIDSYKRKTVFTVFNILFLLSCIGYHYSTNILLFSINYLLNGALYSMVTVFGFTMIVNSVSEHYKSASILWYGIVSKCGMALSPVVAIMLFRTGHSFGSIFTTASVFNALALVTLLALNPKRQSKLAHVAKSTFSRLSLVKALPLGLILVMFTLTYGIINNYMATKGISSSSSNESTIFFIILTIGMILLRVTARNSLTEKLYTTSTLTSALVVVVSILCIGLWNTTWVIYGVALCLGAAYEVLTVTFRRMFINLSPPDRIGSGASNYYIAWDVGMGAGVIVGSSLLHSHSYLSVFALCSIIISLGALLFTFTINSYYLRNKFTRKE